MKPAPKKAPRPAGPNKKDLILAAWDQGDQDLWRLSQEYVTTPSYVASVLQKGGRIDNYSDLFTSPRDPLNIYDRLFRDELGFKTVAVAERSIGLLNTAYKALGDLRDRAGQHHCMVEALTMYNRALAAGKYEAAQVFRKWLMATLAESEHDQMRDPRVA